MSLADAFVESDARYRAQVMYQTWGHLEQKRGELQRGWFVFSIAALQISLAFSESRGSTWPKKFQYFLVEIV